MPELRKNPPVHPPLNQPCVLGAQRIIAVIILPFLLSPVPALSLTVYIQTPQLLNRLLEF